MSEWLPSRAKNSTRDYVRKRARYNFCLVPLKGHSVPSKLTTIANSIAQHIQNVTFDKMVPNRMVLNVKIDQNDRLWLLWCSSFRTERKLNK
jgi:hypothetical protein